MHTQDRGVRWLPWRNVSDKRGVSGASTVVAERPHLYLPVFIEADLPAELAIGGEHPTTDSPWWLFHAIGQDALRQGGARENEVRAAFAPLQDSFLASAYDKAADGHGLVVRGQKAAASRMLSEYVAECRAACR